MTVYSAMVEVRGLGSPAAIADRLADAPAPHPASVTDLGDGWLGIRIQTEATSLAHAAQIVTDLVEQTIGEPAACYVMPLSEYRHRIPPEAAHEQPAEEETGVA